MAYRDPDSPTRPTAVRELVAGMKPGEERKTSILAANKRQWATFRSELHRLDGTYMTTTKKGDGWGWVCKL